MKKPSRSMPKAPSGPAGLIGWLFAAVFLCALGYLFWTYPYASGAVLAVLVLAAIVEGKRRRKKLLRLEEERREEGICEFARSFDTRNTDTWIIRAVYEELQRYLPDAKRSFPIRADDSVVEDLLIDPEDLEDSALRISKRIGRTFDDSRSNPYYGKVQTVRDLVSFFNGQPRRTAT
ncbi:MAG TPA: hypothetical protein VET46_16530 [Steroidobacteraceae bacterium]|nr:hypothetical protein [Steroidobacteraceae bacterium]